MTEKKIAVATTNKGKLVGIKRAFAEHAASGRYSYALIPISVESGVSDTPLSDEEMLEGCSNRLMALRSIAPEADIYAAVEGGFALAGMRWYVRGWSLIHDKALDRTASASGASVQVPVAYSGLLRPAERFTDSLQQFGSDNAQALRDLGANGVFSGGVYTRSDTFYDGIRICLAEIGREENWQ